MQESRFYMIRITDVPRYGGALSLMDLAGETGVHPELIRRFVHLGLVDPLDEAHREELFFEPSAVHVVRKILRLRRDLGINYAGIGVVLELMHRVEQLEARVRQLERQLWG
ncbi:MerR HTH family regulatory protein [Desulfacinum hydrothermale DSM 13146]|uniref:MerR HTH family regulatory protein n=1 Tax=Desulfacinum hydrothermale DSM 13146 TaxID=1121390 RepID=A0A1W1XN15_9BACT|nr:chaperone modulator CbpM [Desulfacinum hydrothermale]SMC25380.1 MerR HTH family regulatory protein [Desulfacinum hydrothermale DSM 13146]